MRERARYVIGADGARSTVRGLTSIGQTDLGFAYDWLVVDVVPPAERTWKPYVVQHCDPARPTTSVASGPGRRRWEFMRLPGETNATLDTLEKAWELLARWQITPANSTLERHTVYTFRGCWADDWKQGRVLLAGDAAHLMPPFLGQGLCSGMRDAMALAWRLPMVLRGEAPEALLASYGPERSAHVQEIIRQAVEVGRLICMLDPAEVAARDEAMKAAMKDPSLALKPPPEPRLGARGLFQERDAGAGFLSMQGRVRCDDREGLFDDIVGTGWQLIVRASGGSAEVSGGAHEALERLGGVVAVFRDTGDLLDVDGTYGAWLDQLGAEAVLVRPDFYVFGTASLAEVEGPRPGRLARRSAARPPTPVTRRTQSKRHFFRRRDMQLPKPIYKPAFNITRASHLVSRVRDLEASRAFYCDLLGLVVSDEDRSTLWLRGLEEACHHSLVLKKGEPAVERVGMRVLTEEDLDLLQRTSPRLASPPSGSTIPHQGRTLHTTDPAGTPLEFCATMETRERLFAHADRYHGACALRLDHFQIVTPRVRESLDFYNSMGFRLSEYVMANGSLEMVFLQRKGNPARHRLCQSRRPASPPLRVPGAGDAPPDARLRPLRGRRQGGAGRVRPGAPLQPRARPLPLPARPRRASGGALPEPLPHHRYRRRAGPLGGALLQGRRLDRSAGPLVERHHGLREEPTAEHLEP